VEEEIKDGAAKAPSEENRAKIWIIAGVLVLAGVALYYFLSYKQTGPQYQTFEFVSGVVVTKDIMNRTITIRADDDQPIPMGAQKRFLISEDTIIQKIFLPDPSQLNTDVKFENAAFGDIQTGNVVTVQGEFSAGVAEKEERVFAINIEVSPTVRFSDIETIEDVTIPKVGIVNSIAGKVVNKTNGRFTIEAGPNQAVGQGERKTILVNKETFFQKITSETRNEKGILAEIFPSSYDELKEGKRVSVTGHVESDISADASMTAKNIIIIEYEP